MLGFVSVKCCYVASMLSHKIFTTFSFSFLLACTILNTAAYLF
uniref:Uncharacterized protein n=1 Tax=Arundo donax TaxID=35708 RepID=A0A0A9DX59_ARUDO